MGTRILPLLVVTTLAAVVVVLTLAIVNNDSAKRQEIIDAETSPAPAEVDAVKAAREVDQSASIPGPESPVQPFTVPPAEPAARIDDPAARPGGPDSSVVERLKAGLARLEDRVARLEAELRRSQEELAMVKAGIGLEATTPPPVEPDKPSKPGEFEPSGEMVDNLQVFRPTGDDYWARLPLDTCQHPEIVRYRIRWSNGNWSPWYTPGVDDEDSTTNYDGSKRRIWSYFADHAFQVLR